ncbi:MAG TPA: UbiA family prenyltransferase [Bacteroidia bacterium]|nr:UbiA family prenyltransferase [Bacteroidia bacterium]
MQLGLLLDWHPYLFIIFFATLFEYNLHRLVTYLTNKEALNANKHKWVRENPRLFLCSTIVSVVGFIIAILMAKKEVVIALLPVAILTFFYSVPFAWKSDRTIRLRDLPFLKIFIISFVWSYCTILLPVTYSNIAFDRLHLFLMLMERFLFIFAITIPFDIRDIEVDKQNRLKTLPLILGVKNSWLLSYILLSLFLLIAIFHYTIYNNGIILISFVISALTTYFFLSLNKFKKLTYYHYGILDGTMFLQGILVLFFYYFCH